MVFSSIPLYLDPSNWHQQPNQHQANVTTTNPQLLPPLPPQPEGSGYGGESIRPGPIANQGTQLTKMALPDQASTQKCPRCESTNTKFCYYNNYNLSQPRHFCKTCRRYWTRGGALRNVPVGGGCRRNKKNKRSSSSKSQSSIDKNSSSFSNSTSATNPLGISTPDLIGRFPQQPSNHHHAPFMASLQNMNRYGVGNISSTNHMEFQNGGRGLTSLGGGGGGGGVFQHFPFLNGFESTNSAGSSYPFHQSENVEAPYGLVKSEDLNRSRNPLNGVSENNNNQYYSWTDLSGLASSSTTHLL